MTNRRLLLYSNGSELVGENQTEFAHGALRDFYGARVRRVLFVPFAAVMRTEDEYAAKVRGIFGPLGYEVESLHEASDKRAAVERAEAFAVGGGNTFKLLRMLYEAGVIEAVRARALLGVPYVGWSAGSNVACPTMRTTNDMPIVEPPTFKALDRASTRCRSSPSRSTRTTRTFTRPATWARRATSAWRSSSASTPASAS